MNPLSESTFQNIPSGALQQIGGAWNVKLYDACGGVTKKSPEDWYLHFLAEGIKGGLQYWGAEIIDFPTYDPNDTQSILMIVLRSDGKAWTSAAAKRPDFMDRLNALAQWIQAGKVILYGAVPSPAKLIRSRHIAWEVATKENYANWFESVWTNLPRYGSILEVPIMRIGDESAWAFAQPNELVVSTRGATPMDVAAQLRGIIIARRPYGIHFNIGAALADSCPKDILHDQKVQSEFYLPVYNACNQIREICISESVQYMFHECLFPSADLPGDKRPSFEERQYAQALVNYAMTDMMAGTGYGLYPIPPGSWQDVEFPGVTAARFTMSRGVGIAPRSRLFSPWRKNK